VFLKLFNELVENSPMEAARESDAAPAAEEALDFDDVTLKGEKKRCKC